VTGFRPYLFLKLRSLKGINEFFSLTFWRVKLFHAFFCGAIKWFLGGRGFGIGRAACQCSRVLAAAWPVFLPVETCYQQQQRSRVCAPLAWQAPLCSLQGLSEYKRNFRWKNPEFCSPSQQQKSLWAGLRSDQFGKRRWELPLDGKPSGEDEEVLGCRRSGGICCDWVPDRTKPLALAVCTLYTVKSILMVIVVLNTIFFLATLKLSFNIRAIYIKHEKYMVSDVWHKLSPKHEAQR